MLRLAQACHAGRGAVADRHAEKTAVFRGCYDTARQQVERVISGRVLARFATLYLLVGTLTSCDEARLRSSFNRARSDPYPLDTFDRTLHGDAAVSCPEVELVTHAGTLARFSPPARVVAPFSEKLTRFESTVHDVAVELYGRAPRRISNAGAYACRAVDGRPGRRSEHALGNAIDVSGFDFGAYVAPRAAGDAGDAALREPPAARLRRSFTVSVVRHYRAKTEHDEVHARFLRRLLEEVEARRVFRSIIGPGHPGHDDHLHFDYAPWSFRAYD
jgi:hypothetical protein